MMAWKGMMASRRNKAKTRRASIQDRIEEMVKGMVCSFRPEKPILFGSHAYGDVGPDSDVDLLVVMPVVASQYQKAVEIGVAPYDIRVSKDLIVTTPEEFQRRKNTIGTIEGAAW